MYRVDIGCVTELGFELVGESSSGDELWSQRLQTLKISSGECAKRKTESASMESDIRPQWKTFLWNHIPSINGASCLPLCCGRWVTGDQWTGFKSERERWA